jgi:hypothetical protein
MDVQLFGSAMTKLRSNPVGVPADQTSSDHSYDEVAALFGDTHRDLLVTGLYLQHMARDAGIDAPLANLRKFADLIRADAMSQGIGLETATFEHLPSRKKVWPVFANRSSGRRVPRARKPESVFSAQALINMSMASIARRKRKAAEAVDA